jgi:hypothetical protein
LFKGVVVSAEQLLVELAQALAAEHARDPSGPGVHVARIGDDPIQAAQHGRPTGGWYASVKRFRERYGKGEFVVCSAKSDRLDDALALLAARWLKMFGPTSQEQGAGCRQKLFLLTLRHASERMAGMPTSIENLPPEVLAEKPDDDPDPHLEDLG